MQTSDRFQSLTITQGRSPNSSVFKIFDNRDGKNDEYYRCNGEHANREVVEHCVLPGGISVPAKGPEGSICRRGKTHAVPSSAAQPKNAGSNCTLWNRHGRTQIPERDALDSSLDSSWINPETQNGKISPRSVVFVHPNPDFRNSENCRRLLTSTLIPRRSRSTRRQPDHQCCHRYPLPITWAPAQFEPSTPQAFTQSGPIRSPGEGCPFRCDVFSDCVEDSADWPF